MKIYALLDMDMLKRENVEISEFINACRELNAHIIQYRDKNAPLNEKEKNL
ncbi:MAG: thiamine phosphate synthase, partial [Epsilonproteobacteria bacterium]|nr:thiamine phosphate synthase [Campylobacterota bacterium]